MESKTKFLHLIKKTKLSLTFLVFLVLFSAIERKINASQIIILVFSIPEIREGEIVYPLRTTKDYKAPGEHDVVLDDKRSRRDNIPEITNSVQYMLRKKRNL